MTPRPLVKTRYAAAVISLSFALGLLSLTGCDPRQAMYFLQPFEPKIAAPCPSLKGKRVVVVTNAVAGTQNDFVALDREITRELVKLLKANVKKIDVVEPREVTAWMQAKPNWTDPAEAAKAFEADVVIFLEIKEFRIQSPASPGLLEGRSNIHIQVTELAHPKDSKGRPMKDAPKETKIIYEGDRETAFPVTGHIPIESGVSPSSFKNKFLTLVATELSWHFVEHAPGDNIQDTKFGE